MEEDKKETNSCLSKDEYWELVSLCRSRIKEELGDQKLPPSEEILRSVREERDEHFVTLFLGKFDTRQDTSS